LLAGRPDTNAAGHGGAVAFRPTETVDVFADSLGGVLNEAFEELERRVRNLAPAAVNR
jgi:hypothetical protein